MAERHDSSDFPSTQWSLIDRLAGNPARQVRDYNDLLLRYWKPVFYFVRSKGRSLHAAEDLTQEFFHRLIDRDWIVRADAQRGKFRHFLLTLLVRFLSDQGPRRRPLQQSFEQGMIHVSTLLSDEERTFEPPDRLTPEAVYEERWTQDLLARVTQATCDLCAAEGHGVWFQLLAETMSAAAADEHLSQPELARRFGLTHDQARYGLEQARSMFGRLLRTELRQDCATEDELHDELTRLLNRRGL